MRYELNAKGFVIVPHVLDTRQVSDCREDITSLLDESRPAGVRGLVGKSQAVSALAQSQQIRSLAGVGLGGDVRLVRSIFFNKDADANWQVAWHQDLAIAVREKSEVEGYSNWSIKDGAQHVQPPVAILERMLTIRLHLDDADESNGALWVSPASHRLGRIPAAQAADAAERLGKQLCEVRAGDALLLRPLTLHASRKGASEKPRRVIHLEFADIDLPMPLRWCEEG